MSLHTENRVNPEGRWYNSLKENKMTTKIKDIRILTDKQKVMQHIKESVKEQVTMGSPKELIDAGLAKSVVTLNIIKHGMPPERGCLSRSMKKQCRSTRLLINYCERDRNINFSDYLNEEQMGMLMLFKLNRF